MIYRLLAILLLLVGLSACSSYPAAFNNEHPGTIPWAGGNLQLLFSNPGYDASDPTIREELLEKQMFGRKNGAPNVSGGVGLMQIWKF